MGRRKAARKVAKYTLKFVDDLYENVRDGEYDKESLLNNLGIIEGRLDAISRILKPEKRRVDKHW